MLGAKVKAFLRPAAMVSTAVSGAHFCTPTRFVSSSAAAEKDFYKVLGISKDATKDQVKKAYRKRAMETHPDQGGSQEEFSAVSEAYETLSNEQKRAMYDKYGPDYAQAAGGWPEGSHRSPEDIFNEFFRGMGMAGMGGPRAQRMQVEDLQVSVDVSLEELYTGVVKPVKVTRPAVCSACRGNGTKSGEPKPKCRSCDGRGQKVEMQNIGNGIIQTVAECRACRGTGKVARADDRCQTCHGNGYKNETSDVPLPIDAGAPSEAVFRVAGEGGSIPEASAGDLIIHLRQKPHKVFTRKRSDLLMRVTLTLGEALLGFERQVRLIDGRTVTLQSSGEVLQGNSVLKVAGEGMPKSTGGRGDLFITISVDAPRTLSPEQRTAIESAFGTGSKANVKDGETEKKTKDLTSDKKNPVIKARVLREKVDEFMARRESEWAQEEKGRSDGRRRDGRGMGGSQEAQCVHQ